MGNRHENGQQQAEGAELDRHENETRFVKREVADIERETGESEAKRYRARDGVPRPAGFSPQEPQKEPEPQNPSAYRGERAGQQQRRRAEGAGKGQRLSAEKTDAHGHVMRSSKRRLVHPAGKYRQQEAEDEGRQYLVLHHDRMQPAGVN